MTDSAPNTDEPSGRTPTHGIPPRQQPYELAFELGFEALLSGRPPDERLQALGAARYGDVIRLPALHRYLLVDMDAHQVSVEEDGRAKCAWAILALHHLCAEDVSSDAREVSLAHFADCRGYLDVFAKRIVARFVATAGRSEQQFVESSERLRAARLPGPAVGYRFDVFPRVPIAIVRYEGDEELRPGASVIYRADAAHLLPAEDRIVATELLLDTLCGKSMEEP